jgi:EcsC protein family
MKSFTQSDLIDIKTAVALLETPSLTSKLSSMIGKPLEAGLKNLSKDTRAKIETLVHTALHKATDAALWSLDEKPQSTKPSNILHKAMAATSGAVGGVFGLPALAVELPITTTIMLRSIADIARSEGFNLTELQTKAACIEVFAFGGHSDKDDSTVSVYYLDRIFMAEAVQAAGKVLAETAKKQVEKAIAARGFTPGEVGNWLAKLIETVANRFGIVITEKSAAQAVPLLGALTGATINTMFMNFYQDIAKGHFIIKRLEAVYGEEAVKDQYMQLMRVKALTQM